MKHKKITALVLTLCMILSLGITALADEGIVPVENGDFETVNGDAFSAWEVSGGSWNKEFTVSDDANSGKNALRITTDGNAYAQKRLSGLTAGTAYTISGYIKLLEVPEGNNSGPAIKVEFYGNEEYINGSALQFISGKKGAWKPFEYTFVCPAKTNSVDIFLRVVKGGDVIWDDISMVGKKVTSEEEPIEGIIGRAPLDGAEYLVDCDFETLQNGRVPGASTLGNDYSKWLSIVEDKERGGNVLRIADEESDNHPWMNWKVPVTPGATYQMSGWYKRAEAGTTGYSAVCIEYYGEQEQYYGGKTVSLSAAKKGEGWATFTNDFIIPNEDIAAARVYVRLIADGEVYFDDVSFYLVENAPLLASVDSGFAYYRDEIMGKAKVDINYIPHPDIEGKQMVMKLMDGETVLEETSVPAKKETMEWSFSTGKMTEVEKSYTLHVEYIDRDGTVLEQCDREVMIFNRPKNLTKDGYVLDNKGQVFPMVLGTSVIPDHYEKVREMGITVACCCYQAKDLEYVLDALNKADEVGLKLLVPLYSNMMPAGHPDNVQTTIKGIKAFKNHPAFLGYMVMDEPFGHTGRVGGVNQMYQILQDSYKLIRQYDKDHLIYIVETNMNFVELTGNCCDILTVDPYIGTKTSQRGSMVSRDVAAAVEVVKNRKPIASIVQAWPWNGDNGDYYYLPTENDIRSFLYQSLIAGANAIGYYPVLNHNDTKNPAIWDYPLIDGINYFNQNEWVDAQKAFITGEYPTFAQNTDADSPYWYKAFVKGKDLYVVVINREDKVNEIEIPLTSIDGSVTIGTFRAEPDKISGMTSFGGNGTLKATLSEAQVVRFKLTVSENLSGLTTSKYRDVYDYGWAKGSIDRMYQKGVTNAKGISIFAPAEQITRGDFAMFLVKTLGLTANTTDNFADVNPYAEYAEAISIGKALGILKGTDGVNFNPETPISRQDFMVICARGMRLVKALEEGDASQFADAATISDYAVADIAAMVKANIVGGYEDGTVRPLGNATRAEAAVIMDRITNWNK